jgi:hypothetical protein
MCRQASDLYIISLAVMLIYPFLRCTEQIKLIELYWHANRLRKGNAIKAVQSVQLVATSLDALSSYKSSKCRLQFSNQIKSAYTIEFLWFSLTSNLVHTPPTITEQLQQGNTILLPFFIHP